VPRPARRLALAARTWLAELPERRRILARPLVVPRDRIALWAPGTAPSGAIVHGGRVKLGALAGRFPGAIDRFNVLYLASSALPPAAPTWAAWARDAGARVVVNQDGVAYPGWEPDHWRAINAYLKVVLDRADLVLFQSEFCRAAVERFLGPVAAPHHIVPNAVDTRRFVPRPGPLPVPPLVLLAAGTHQAEYRVRSVLEVAHALRGRGHDVRLLLAGGLEFPDGPERTRRMIADLGLREHVEVLGPYTRDEAPGLFRRAHLLVHPKDKDSCPTTVIEAMSAGLPVVAAQSGGVPELVGSGGGRTVPVPGGWETVCAPDPGRLADAVVDLAADLPANGAAARRRAVERFDEQAWLARHEEMLAALLAVPHATRHAAPPGEGR
jgi:glycosyltransferase involved in cell wall biosynthesis